MEYELIDREVCYQGFFRLERYHLRHQLFNGGWTDVLTREIFERGHAVAVLPYDPVRDEVVLLEQFRAGALDFPGGPWLTEIVAGIIDAGETVEQVAHREAREEAGCTLLELVHICDYLVSPGGTTETISLYCGRVDATGLGGVHGLDHEHEDIRVSTVKREQAMRWLEEGRIESAAPIIALQWLQLNHQRLAW